MRLSGGDLGLACCRLPKEIVLQQGHLPDAARPPRASTVARFTAALKRAGRRFRANLARGGAKVGKAAIAASTRAPVIKLQGSERRSSGALGLSTTGSLPDPAAVQMAAMQQPTGVHSSPILPEKQRMLLCLTSMIIADVNEVW